MYKNFGKDRACDSRDILTDKHTDRQTHRPTDTRSSQYFANGRPTAGKEIKYLGQCSCQDQRLSLVWCKYRGI